MISTDTLNRIVQQIVQSCKPEKVILFGSYGYGTPDPDSDLDILVISRWRGTSSERIRRVLRAIKEEGFSIDVIVKTPTEFEKGLKGRNWFLQEVAEKGRVLYAR